MGAFSARHARLARSFARVGRGGRSQASQTDVAERSTQAPSEARRKRVLSGVQPTGTIHLGNYMGAIRNWVTLQEQYDTYFCVVDLHAITAPHDPMELRESSKASAALYLASGLDPEKTTIFLQSHVSAHCELTWLLNCDTPIGWLQRMIQFKEKSKKQGEEVNMGLLGYPVLMAADILLYQADLVPVGEDQRQHLELTRDIAARFNNLYGGRKWKKLGGRGGKIFKVPDAFIPPSGARIMSLQDGTSKMSKSAESDMSRINLLDSPELIMQKVKKCKTDAYEGLEFGNPDRPEANNLLTIYHLVTGVSKEEISAECANLRWGEFKPRLAEAIITHLEPIQQKYHNVMEDPAYLDHVLRKGAEEARVQAGRTLNNCREAMGFTPFL